jgi:TRAP-type C4-dicarboxylate transport system substrate-binding protein
MITPAMHTFRFDRLLGAVPVLWLFTLLLAPLAQAQPVEVRYATILPRGIGQDFVLVKLEQDWRQATAGTIILRRSPGGQKEGEAGIVRKLRSGNYQAALLSVIGLSEIEPDVAVLQKMPLVFRDWAEVDYVREKIRGRLEERLLAQGFVVLFWADSGWVNFFSTREAETPAEYRKMRLFVWAGDEPQIKVMKSLGYQPIALETDYVFSSLASGMIDAAPLAPTFAMGVQIPTVATHVLDLNWTPIVGAAIIRKDVWEKIPSDLRARLQPLCEAAGAAARAEGRRFHEDAMNTLRKGPKTCVHTLTPAQRVEWQELASALGPQVRGELVPAAIYDEVQQLLREYRACKLAAR